ncbi:MAG: PhoPQ-activated pathogenicity-related family protein [Armatimonadetes bacterium]|nr:PhoPQ-activated pathogenicity-related family protein [Armatimonadota bacterium]CUU38360.1 PhoPQ-activated pathogenicity-related protein [Armatimonadetes bacterium DC]
MRSRYGFWTVLIGVLLWGTTALAQTPLDDYFQRPEPAYRWEKRDAKRVGNTTVYTLFMISQTWQGIDWDHSVQIFYPDNPRFPHFAALLNTGGNPSAGNEALGALLATQTGVPFVILYNIPKQPLFGGLTEDALIVYTWQKFLQTNDPTWPLHFPMAKAVLKCMDTVQAFLRQEGKKVPQQFMVTGASKRGWTAWLVGASRDKRVAGIAPMVIDVLNLPAQVPHHLEFYKGVPSEEIGDYVAGGMLQQLNTPAGRKLVELEDPYSYRERYTMPKLIINGTNDRYWAQDALNLYWDGLPEPKWVLYVPNSGHGLEDRPRVYATMSAFIRTLAQGKRLPTMRWELKETPEGLEITAFSTPPAKEARLWFTTSLNHDFRDSKWTWRPMERTPDGWRGFLARPRQGHAVGYAELVFEQDGQTYTLTTQLRIIGAQP